MEPDHGTGPASPHEMPPRGPTPPSGGTGPLSAEQKRELGDASARLHRLLRAARISTTTFWTLVACGAVSTLWALASQGSGIIVGLALLATAWNERRGRDRMRAVDPGGARILGWNQLATAGVIIAYCLVAIVRAGSSVDPSLDAALGASTSALVVRLTRLFYGVVIAVVALSQALLARYYFRREPMLEAFRRETPGWILDVLSASRAGSTPS